MTETFNVIALIPCAMMAVAVGILVWWIWEALHYEELEQGEEWRYDITRINALAQQDVIYRVFSGGIRVLARLNRVALRNRLRETEREIQAAGLSRHWLPEEYWARIEIISIFMFMLYLPICLKWMGPAGAVSAIAMMIVTVWILRRRLSRKANQRLTAIKRRLPYLLDLLTLLMEAGSSFLDALRQSVSEFSGHSVSIEFGRVLTDMNMGKSRNEAFDNMRNRLNDDEISSIVGSMIQSEELGTPLTHVLRSQAEVLRIKRSQRAETIAAEAGVNMLLPGILVMAATILIILGPFVLNFFIFGPGL